MPETNYLDARVSPMPNPNLAAWTKPDIDAQCSAAHGRYDRELALHYTDYFAGHPELRGSHRHCAVNMEAALPTNWSRLADRIPLRCRHRHHLSGKSSQILALGLLGPASEIDPSLGWLWTLVGSPASPVAPDTLVQFEYEVAPTLLNEAPHVTTIDYLVTAPDIVICTEAKWAERGLGPCSCARQEDGDPTIGECTERILRRQGYWDAAREIFGLPALEARTYCPISTSYQAIRNVAAARALAGQRKCAFLLIYDDNNPYFRQCGEWPGWPALLRETLSKRDGFLFRTVSWQELVTMLPLDEYVRAWARDKHRLPV